MNWHDADRDFVRIENFSLSLTPGGDSVDPDELHVALVPPRQRPGQSTQWAATVAADDDTPQFLLAGMDADASGGALVLSSTSDVYCRAKYGSMVKIGRIGMITRLS